MSTKSPTTRTTKTPTKNTTKKRTIDKNPRGGHKRPTGDDRGGKVKTPIRTRKKPGPKTTTFPPNTDPSKPCQNPKEEHFCDLVAQNYTGIKAYQIAINPKSRNKTAATRSSELRNREDLARRILDLQATQHKPTRGHPAPAAPQEPQQKPAQPAGLITRDELNRKVSEAVRQAVTATEKTQAVKLAQSLLNIGDDEGKPVDPVALIQHIATSAGRSPQDIAAQAGGLRFMLETVATYAKAPRSTLRRTLAAWHRELGTRDTPEDTHAPDTQTGTHLLPDGQSDNADQPTETTPAAAPLKEGGGTRRGGTLVYRWSSYFFIEFKMSCTFLLLPGLSCCIL